MPTPKHEKSKNEGAPEIIAVIVMTVVGIGGVVWLFASNHIVWASLNPILTVGSMWKWVKLEATYSEWNALVASANTFAAAPGEVGIITWLGFVNTALLPLAVLSFVAYLIILLLVVFRKRSGATRKLTPDMLLENTLRTFSGIGPVLKIRKKIVNNELSEWRVQVSPEEVFSGKVGNRSMISSGEFDRDVAREYFIGSMGFTSDGRMISRMLGRQVVNIIEDRRSGKPVLFTERLSSEGKVLAALWSAVAFGGEDGKKEYITYSSALNMSAYGSPTGMANLTLAQPLFDKYKKNKELMKLFAIHHWEHTLLFSLLEIAQRRGRYTTAEVLWLRPTNRVMYWSLNTCGSKVPHVEAASTFAQVAYEKKCASLERLPLYEDPVAPGTFRHFIAIERCIDGLEAYYQHWKISTDDDFEWWSSDELWKTRDSAVSRILSEATNLAPVPPVPAGDMSDFDNSQISAREKIDEDLSKKINVELGAVFGNPNS
jgi:hypothetical protein